MIAAGEFDVVRATLSALFTDGSFQTLRFMMAEFLTIVTSQWIWDVRADLDEVITNFDFCRYLGCVKGENICVGIDGFLVPIDCNAFYV